MAKRKTAFELGLLAKRIRYARVRMKHKPRKNVDLSKIGLGKVHIEIEGDKGNRVVVITRAEENAIDNPNAGDHNSH